MTTGTQLAESANLSLTGQFLMLPITAFIVYLARGLSLALIGAVAALRTIHCIHRDPSR